MQRTMQNHCGVFRFKDMLASGVEKILSLAGDIEGLDESDPRQAARVMRRLFDATGMPVGGGMEEALRRMESGEDPDRIEEELVDVMEQDPFAGEPTKKARASAFRRRWLPPTVDPTLYDM